MAQCFRAIDFSVNGNIKPVAWADKSVFCVSQKPLLTCPRVERPKFSAQSNAETSSSESDLSFFYL